MASKEDKSVRTAVHLFFDEELLARISSYRFRFEHPTRAGAIRELILKGLEVVERESGPIKRGKKKA